ncbi:HIT-like domain-containing protein [Exophiala viscosa]|uniref:HIT-like domain-containing protein n=1 Tax=Exophiala viscosa TaxID=2486360 RepID=UPI00218D542C|nr:HIT-like domain-containing protein [Exophiala viscosa]
MSTAPETKAQAESLIPQFRLEKVLNQDQNGRRISLLGTISSEQALITLERAAFPSDPALVSQLLSSLTNTTNLGANDIYRWYMANRSIESSSTSTADPLNATSISQNTQIPDLKINLIYPCTAQHIRKYSAQRVRMVTETPEIYETHIKPYIARQRAAGRLDWVFNILEGRTEQEDVIARHDWDSPSNSGFLLLPDLNWDRKTVQGMHLLALVQRRDIWSLRDLRKKHIPWLKAVRDQVVSAATKVFPREIDADEVKCYVHYQPTYYHFHIHAVHVMLEAGTTQSVGKAFGLGNIISQLECVKGDEEAGMDGVDLMYFVGEENDLWKKCFGPLKNGEAVQLS